MANTVYQGWAKPTVGGSSDTWGTTLNATIDAIDTLVGSVTAAEIAVLDGLTASTAEINYISGATSNIQAQIDSNQSQITSNQTQINNIMPSGTIVMWSGSAAAIPSGFVLCDGANSTPDLRNMFVVGAGSTYAVGATGGSADAVVVSHTHTATVTDPGHTHNTQQGVAGTLSGSDMDGHGDGVIDTPNVQPHISNAQSGSTASSVTGATVANSTEGVSGTNANLPPYHALCYIMKT